MSDPNAVPDHDQFPVTVRTTIQPTEEIQIETVQEWTDLKRQGLLLDGYDGLQEQTKPVAASAAAPRPSAPSTTAPTRTES